MINPTFKDPSFSLAPVEPSVAASNSVATPLPTPFAETPSSLTDWVWTVMDYIVPPVISPLASLQRIATRVRIWLAGYRPAPGAMGHGILGSFPELKKSNDIMTFVMDYFKRYQDKGFCRIKLGMRTYYFIGNKEYASYIMENDKLFPRGESLDDWRLFSPKGLEDSEYAKEQRHRAMQVLSPLKIPELFLMMRETSCKLADLWDVEKSAGRSIHLSEWCARFTLAGMGKELFYTDLLDLTEENKENTLKIIHSLHQIFDVLVKRIVSLSPFLESTAALDEAKKNLFEGLKPIVTAYWNSVRETVNSKTADEKQLANLKHLYGIPEGVMSEEQIKASVDDFVGFLQAAFETTATALTWTLYELARNPSVQAKLIDELKNCDLASLDQVTQMTYLRKVVEETLRMHPPIPFTLRDNLDPLKFPFFATEHGSAFIVSPHLIHSNEWERSDEFLPDRFTDEMLQEKWQQAHPEYFVFIKGKHQCVGRHFAKQKMLILIAVIMKRFAIEIDTALTPMPVLTKLRVTAQPSHPIYLKLV